VQKQFASGLKVMADADRLGQAFRNLLENSARYTDAGGTVRVTARRNGSGVKIDFEDSSPGVPGDALPRLFERFYRVEGSRSRANGGAGLGLAIVRSVVEAHGGAIEAGASPLGGLRVTISLPGVVQ
jgi:two-component system sensor histidine kinase BaeS